MAYRAPRPHAEKGGALQSRLARLTGVTMKPKRMETILRALGFEPIVPTAAQQTSEDVWPTKVPTFRPDVEGSADIVEELIRIGA